ncbi:MAG: NAD(P)/FAD-dependent oxidoreductase [Chloroflexi bacterium]|nr:MAG: NAD(P)/FAD-dependent oxidoreductase [Chloroflexota bacterium]MBL1194671.1 NAD(P)/FAD-dependent oxidoreductase [Chloroflexota bacterium]NOH11962.1 NAD(P)/FAD-dependent oxidoreductase [Chloroflexota bacterium]
MNARRPRVIIVGAGFGGLFAAKTLNNKAVDVLLIDRHNYHTFTPLLYQVATSALDPSEIAYPIRSIFRGSSNVDVLLGDLTDINPEKQTISVRTNGDERTEAYDYLILATGSEVRYFGDKSIREHAFELRNLPDTTRLRNHLLRRFEEASWEPDADKRHALTTIVVVGGGPTGLETAGAVHELFNDVLAREFEDSDLQARVVLVEASPDLLKPYPENLRQAALEQLQSLGVEVVLSNPVVAVSDDEVTLGDGMKIPTKTFIWSAGVKASPVVEMLDVDVSENGRVFISPTTEVIGHEHIYAVGDMAYLENEQGDDYPMMIPPAQQQGQLAAKNILADIAGKAQNNFKYIDRGIMATIGRSRAVAWLYNRIPLRGFIAWVVWLIFHLMTLIGFRNRLNVLINWAWYYFTYDRSVRIILESPKEKD